MSEDHLCYFTWRSIIRDTNKTFFANEPEFQISEDVGEIYELLKKDDDGSMTDEEKKGWTMWCQFHGHLKKWRILSEKYGMENMPTPIQKWLKIMNEDIDDDTET